MMIVRDRSGGGALYLPDISSAPGPAGAAAGLASAPAGSGQPIRTQSPPKKKRKVGGAVSPSRTQHGGHRRD